MQKAVKTRNIQRIIYNFKTTLNANKFWKNDPYQNPS